MIPPPDNETIISNFNNGCGAYALAMEAAAHGEMNTYELEVQRAANLTVNVLEWAVRSHLQNRCWSGLTVAQQKLFEQPPLPPIIKLLSANGLPPVDPVLVERFIEHRKLRNDTTHGGSIPSHSAVLRAFSDIRTFLVTNLGIEDERLSTHLAGLRPGSAAEGTSSSQSSEELGPASHRTQGAAAWLRDWIESGIARLQSEHPDRYAATIVSLRHEAEFLLTREALGLCGQSTPDGPLSLSPEPIEAEIQKILARPPGTRLEPPDVDRLRNLMPLVTRRVSLCFEAGWLERTNEGSVRFSSPTAAALFVGAAITRDPQNAASLRAAVVENRSWAEAAWAAVAAGDAILPWVTLLKGDASARFVEHVVAVCAAFGGMTGITGPIDAIVRDGFRTCVAALLFFAPRKTNAFGQPVELGTPWYLPADVWCRCILDLAHAEQFLEFDQSGLGDLLDVGHLPEPLAQILSALAITGRVGADEARFVALLCAPRYSLTTTDNLESALGLVMRPPPGYVQVIAPIVREWVHTFAVPVCWKCRPDDGAVCFSTPAAARPAGYLLRTPALIREWERAWQALPPDKLTAALTGALPFLWERDDEPTRAAVRTCLARLRRDGRDGEARTAVRSILNPAQFPVQAEGAELASFVDILRLVSFSSAEWLINMATWSQEPSLPWKALLDAGAPQGAIAEWCMRKLARREEIPAAFRRGPVGVVIRNAVIKQSGDWEIAFREAWSALEWFQANGDEGAIGALAGACLGGGDGPHVDPEMWRLEDVNLSVPLSQVLWGRVIGRPAGRAALLARVERALPIGMVHFLEGVTPYGHEQSLWLQVAVAVGAEDLPWRPKEGYTSTGSPGMEAEALRVFQCFERQRQQTPALGYINNEPARAVIVASVASRGVDVTAVVHDLLKETITAKSSPPATLAAIGYAVVELLRHHPEGAKAILLEALSPATLPALCTDETLYLWAALFACFGKDTVASALLALEVPDVGLGLFDALETRHPELLSVFVLRPDFLRVVVLRHAQGNFIPPATFWEQAWRLPPAPMHIKALLAAADGMWLSSLIEQSEKWEPPARSAVFRPLALLSGDQAVRARCLRELILGDH